MRSCRRRSVRIRRSTGRSRQSGTRTNTHSTFSNEEIAPIRRLKAGLMRAKPEPTPIRGKTLALSERLFDDDAVILDVLASSSVRYAGPRGPSIEMSWEGFRELGIWSKPGGAPFLCIEPWQGFASPAGFRWRIRRQAGPDAHRAGGEARCLGIAYASVEALRSAKGQIPGPDTRVEGSRGSESALLPLIPAAMDTAEPRPHLHPEEEIDEPTDCPCR